MSWKLLPGTRVIIQSTLSPQHNGAHGHVTYCSDDGDTLDIVCDNPRIPWMTWLRAEVVEELNKGDRVVCTNDEFGEVVGAHGAVWKVTDTFVKVKFDHGNIPLWMKASELARTGE